MKALELELEIAENRLKIGSKMIKSLVLDTKDSMTYFVQQFDIITRQSSSVNNKKGQMKQYRDSVEVKRHKEELARASVRRNVHVAVRVPKLIKTKAEKSYRSSIALPPASDINKKGGRNKDKLIKDSHPKATGVNLSHPSELEGSRDEQIVKFDLRDLKPSKEGK